MQYTPVDGASSAPVRKALWEISQKREYPQVFLPGEGGGHVFAGGMDDIQEVRRRGPRPIDPARVCDRRRTRV